jgi:thiamine pyrophosphokinase
VDDPIPPNRIVVIVAGGDPIDASVVASLPPDVVTIAADSGLDQAERLGLPVDLVVGDMDSVAGSALERARGAGAEIQVHSPDKDATDLELALAAALDHGAAHLILLGGKGGRLDHFLGNALLLADPRLADVDVEWRLGTTQVIPARPGRPVRVRGVVGELVSIIPIGGPAAGLTTSGLRWPLDAETLPSGSTRGISNEMTDPIATITVTRGVALVIHERTST